MIDVTLNVRDICHKCPSFEPKYIRQKYWADYGTYIDQIVVECENKNLCKFLEEYIKKGE